MVNVLNLVLFVSKPSSGDDNYIELFLDSKRYELEEGISYIVKEKRNVKGMELFTKSIARGYRGLYITRQHPNYIAKSYETNGMEIIWLSTTLGKDYMDPHNLAALLSKIRTFIEKNESSIILLDGMEYLMINNVYLRLIRFVEQIKELTANMNSIFLISVDEDAFEPKEMSFLERGLKPIDG